MPHLSKFRVGHYRGLDGLELDTIAPVNLITGPNGIGKTSLLEALSLFYDQSNTLHLWEPEMQRTREPVTDPIDRLGGGELVLSGAYDGDEHTWRAVFEPALRISAEAALPTNGSARVADRPARTAGVLRVRLDDQERASNATWETPHGIVHLPQPDSGAAGVFLGGIKLFDAGEAVKKDFGRLVRAGRKEELLLSLNIVEPRVTGIDLLPVADGNGRTYFLATTDDGKRLPLEALGGGVFRLFHILVALLSARARVVFVDEIERGLHKRMLHDFWVGLRKLSAGNQVFASTHSLECVDAALRVFEDAIDDLAVHNLRPKLDGSGIASASFRGETLLAGREMNLEVR